MKLERRFVKNSLFVFLGLTTLSYTSQEKIEDTKERNSMYYSFPGLSNIQFPLRKKDVLVSIPELVPLYTDCDQKNYHGKKPTFKKTPNEVLEGARKRKSWEEQWNRYFEEQVMMTYASLQDVDTTKKWYNPLKGVRNSFRDGFKDTRIRAGRWKEQHHAIDIMAKTGSPIQAPVSGVIIASADDWKGSWNKKWGFQYEKGGLGELSGNGVILFNPSDTGYYFMIHMNKVFTKAGDIVSRGEVLGTVGITGNAMSPLVPKHLHLAYKKPGKACGIEGVLISQNPYEKLREITNVRLARKNVTRHEKKFEGSY